MIDFRPKTQLDPSKIPPFSNIFFLKSNLYTQKTTLYSIAKPKVVCHWNRVSNKISNGALDDQEVTFFSFLFSLTTQNIRF